MSTPRPQKGKCWSVQCIPSRGITVRCGGQDEDCPYRVENHGPLMQELREPHYHELIEGVAAPLEPTRQEFVANLEHEWIGQKEILDFRNWLIEKLWTAAAVSKNLQQSVEQLCRDLKAIQQDYTNEKKRAENLQEELTRWLIRSDRKSVYGYAYAKEGELACEVSGLAWYDTACILRNRLEAAEKEIAALREKPL